MATAGVRHQPAEGQVTEPRRPNIIFISEEQPFYLHLGFLSPHDLYDAPQRFIDQYDDQYDDASIPLPEVTE